MNAPGLSSGDDAARLREGAGFTRRFTPSGEEETASRSSRSWEVGKLGSWEVGKLGSWEVGKLGSWEVGKLGSWEVGKLGSWEVGKLGSWEVGKLGSWEVGKFPIHYSTGGRGAQRRGRFAGADGEIAGFPARRRRFTHEKYRLLTAESGRASGGADATSCGRLSKSAADGNPLPEKRPGRGGARAAPRGFAPFGEARGFQVSQGRSLPGAAPRFGNRPHSKDIRVGGGGSFPNDPYGMVARWWGGNTREGQPQGVVPTNSIRVVAGPATGRIYAPPTGSGGVRFRM